MKLNIIVVLLGCTLNFPAFAQAQTESPVRKNVLFLAVDDLNTWLLGEPKRYSGKVVAPNIKNLAATGVNFVSAYTACPKCSPSRTAIHSGVAPWKSGVYENGLDIDASAPLRSATALSTLFMKAGYFTASSGKIEHGWGGDWDERLNHKRDPTSPGAPLNGWAIDKSGRPTEKDWGPTHLPEAEMNDTKYADFAIRQLKKGHEKPFFIACGMFHPHFPWYVPQKYFDLFPLDEVVIPEIKNDDLDDIPEGGQSLVDGGLDKNIRKHHQHKEAIRAYLASTAYADAQIGRVLDALENSPYKENTIVVLWSDHGFHLGEKGHWAKSTLWEEGTHSLLMLRVPGMTKAGEKCDRFVSLLDLYPTLAELSGIERPAHLDGTSLVPLLKNPKAKWESTAITAFNEHISILTKKFRYIRYKNGGEEFYQSKKDPHEWTNQIANSEFAPAINRYRKMIPGESEMVPQIEWKRPRGDKKPKPEKTENE